MSVNARDRCTAKEKSLEKWKCKIMMSSNLSVREKFCTAYQHSFHTRQSQPLISVLKDLLDQSSSIDASCSLLHKNEASVLVAHVDGGSHGNPGPSGIGVVIQGTDGEKTRISKWIGHQDNNVAEYVALLEALQHALALNAKVLRVYSDSQVVVRQMTGQYACRSPRLYSLHWTCRKLARALDFSIAHIDREENSEANRLVHEAVRSRL